MWINNQVSTSKFLFFEIVLNIEVYKSNNVISLIPYFLTSRPS